MPHCLGNTMRQQRPFQVRWRNKHLISATVLPPMPGPRLGSVTCRASGEDYLYSRDTAPDKFYGPIKVVKFEGKGRGIVATADISPGQLLMLDPALALVDASTQQRPEPDELVDAIMGDQAILQSPWVPLLYDGTKRSTQDIPDLSLLSSSGSHSSPGNPAAASASPSSAAATTMSSSSGAAAAASPTIAGKKAGFSKGSVKAKLAKKRAQKESQMNLNKVLKLVNYNCYGDNHEDLAAAEVRGEAARGHVGLWPAFAMLNHSCIPNAMNYVLGRSMVVRAVKPIPAGAEVTISYLGRPQLAPVSARVQALDSMYGFECSCERCLAEAEAYEKVDDILEEAHAELSEKLSAAATSALREGNEEGIADALTALQGHTNRLLQRYRRAMVPPKLRLWYSAGISEAFELAASCQQALGQDAGASMLACLRAVEEVSTGSDLHVITASKYLHMLQQEQQRQGAAAVAGTAWQQQQQQRLAAAKEGCRAAHQARYGIVSDALYEKLAEANRTLYD